MLIPKEEPVTKSIQSSYVISSQLIDYYKDKLSSGCIHYLSENAEGVIYLANKSILSTYFLRDDVRSIGEEAIEEIINVSAEENISINIYAIPEEVNHLYATLTGVDYLYREMNAEEIDLDKVISKMIGDELTCSIEVIIKDSEDCALLFYQQGRLIKGSYSYNTDGAAEQAKVDELIEKSKKLGGHFNVKKFSFGDFGKNVLPAESEDNNQEINSEILEMLNEILAATENLFNKKWKGKQSFERSLKQKFLEKADDYPFLDPFFNQVKYIDGQLSVISSPDAREMVEGLVTSVLELGDNAGIKEGIMSELTHISDKFPEQWDYYGAKLLN